MKTGIGKLMCRFESYLFRLFTPLLELVVRMVLETIVLKTCRFKSYRGYYTVSIDKRFKSPDCGSGHRGFESR